MRTGILTFQRACNYGAVLQCYALQSVLENLGCEVSVIDYRQPYIERFYAVFSWRKAFSMLLNLRVFSLLRYLRDARRIKSVKSAFSRFQKDRLRLTEACNEKNIPPFDRYVIGSDQVWSLHCTGGFDGVFWGDFKRKQESRLVGYAISAVEDSLTAVGQAKVRSLLGNFSSVSFREKTIRDKVKQMTGVEAAVVLDPVLLANPDLWDDLIEEKQPSVVLHLFGYRLSDGGVSVRKKAQQIAEQLGCCVVDLSNRKASPKDFVSWFKSAKYVITNSYHGVLFALAFEKPLYAVKCNDALDERYENILHSVGAEEMLCGFDFSPLVRPVDYVPIRNKVEELRTSSIEYLKNALAE